MNETVKQLREILANLARVENSDNDAKEIVYDRELSKVKQLDKTNIIAAVKEAVGNDSKRIRYAPFVFAQFAMEPGIESTFRDLLGDADELGRSVIIQTIGLHRLRDLVGTLNDHFACETDDFCRDQLLMALGTIADESSLPIFTHLMRNDHPRDRWRILCAAHNYARVEFKDYLLSVFRGDDKKSHRIMAAWGLAKLRSAEAYAYLITMLDDSQTVIKTADTTTYDPGESIRAAQAICDVNGWEFEWGKDSVEAVKRLVGQAP